MSMTRLIVAPSLLFAMTAAAANGAGHDFPTQDRVEYVFDCMRVHGGENYDNLYKCSCSIDYIASKMTYDDFVTADTFERAAHAMGEREEVLREGVAADASRGNYQSIKAQAGKHCGLPKQSVSRRPR